MSSPYDQPGMLPERRDDQLARVTGILNIIFGILELLFAAFSLFGMVMGGAMLTFAARPDDGMLGGMMLGIYIVLGIGALTAGVLHLIGGVQLLKPVPNRTWVWAAAVGSIGSVLTIYCSIFGIAAAILMLIWLTRPEPGEDEILD